MLNKTGRSSLAMAAARVTALVSALVFVLSAGYAAAGTTKDALDSVVVIRTEQAIGSGFAVGEHLVITNAHVVSGHQTVNLVTYDDSALTGQVIKVDETTDLALVQVNGTSFVPLPLNLEELNPGDDVYAIGAPSNIPFTMTKGIISSGSRWINGEEYIQIDASINTGNSGGPLLNASGEVIGINTLKLQDAEGIGFALKSRYIQNFISNSSSNNSSNISPVDPVQNQEQESEAAVNALQRQNETLLGVVIVLSLLLLISIILNMRQLIVARRKKREQEFEIEVEEPDQINHWR